MGKVTAKKAKPERTNTVSHRRRMESFKTVDSPVGKISHLQRTLGNQTVQRLFKSGVIQAKLKIGKPNDKYEKEADRVADIVMQMPEPHILKQTEEEEEEEPIQTKGDNSSTAVATPGIESSINSLKEGGQPLPEWHPDHGNVPRIGSHRRRCGDRHERPVGNQPGAQRHSCAVGRCSVGPIGPWLHRKTYRPAPRS